MIRAWIKAFWVTYICSTDPNPEYSKLDKMDGLGDERETD